MANELSVKIIALGISALLSLTILFLINKRVKFFTKGTILFMASALTIFTAVDFAIFANDIKRDQSRVNSRANQNVVESFLKAVFDGRVDDMVRQVDDLRAEAVQGEVEGLKDKLVNDIAVPFGQLVSLHVDRGRYHFRWNDSSPWSGPSYHGWHYRALFSDGADGFGLLEGRVFTRDYSIGPDEGLLARVWSIEGGLEKHTKRNGPSRVYQKARTYQNPEFSDQLGSRRRLVHWNR